MAHHRAVMSQWKTQPDRQHSATRTSQMPVKEIIIGAYLWPAERMVPLKILDRFWGIWAKPIIKTYFMPISIKSCLSVKRLIRNRGQKNNTAHVKILMVMEIRISCLKYILYSASSRWPIALAASAVDAVTNPTESISHTPSACRPSW